MKDRKKELEDLLAHSIELQRRQQLLPQEKVSIVIQFNNKVLVIVAYNYTLLHC